MSDVLNCIRYAIGVMRPLGYNLLYQQVISTLYNFSIQAMQSISIGSATPVAQYMDILCSNTLWRGTVVERRFLAGELSLSCARPAADG